MVKQTNLDKYIIKNIIKLNENNENLWKAIIISKFFRSVSIVKLFVENNCLFVNHNKAISLLKQKYAKQNKLIINNFITPCVYYKNKYYPRYLSPFILIKQINNYFTETHKYHQTFDSWLQDCNSLKGIFLFLCNQLNTTKLMAYKYAIILAHSKRYFLNKTII